MQQSLALAALVLVLASCAPPAAVDASAPAGGLGADWSPSFEAQPGWVVETPEKTTRVAQYRLPGEGAASASVVVFWFGGGGGSAEANFERWLSQFEAPTLREQTRDERQSGVVVHRLDLAGTWIAETSPGSGVREHRDGYRAIQCVLETPRGPYYARLLGPDATVERWAASFRAFVDRAAGS